jgi:trehalose/maltose transport system substrate-binding protein
VLIPHHIPTRAGRTRTCQALGVALLVGMSTSCHQPPKQPTTVKYLRPGWVSENELPAETILSHKFEDETGTKLLQLRGVQENALDQLALTRRQLGQGALGPDVLEIDPTWLGTVQNDLMDLGPILGRELGPMNSGLAASYQSRGKLLAIPYQKGAGVLKFRSDLLSAYGYKHPPSSWEQLEQMAARIQAGERAKGHKQFWGYVWPGAAAESLTCNGLEWQVDEGGGNILESNGTVSVNNPSVLKAWLRAKNWVGRISPPGVVEYRESDAASVFDAGNAAFIREWGGEPGRLSLASDEVLTVRQWGIASQLDRTSYAPMPRGSSDRAAVLGGMGLAISKYSAHPQEDAALIRFLIREQLQSMENGTVRNLTHDSVSYGVSIAKAAGEASHTSAEIPPRVISRPSAQARENYVQVSKEYSAALHAVLTGITSAPKALAQLETRLTQITGLKSGPPQ